MEQYIINGICFLLCVSFFGYIYPEVHFIFKYSKNKNESDWKDYYDKLENFLHQRDRVFFYTTLKRLLKKSYSQGYGKNVWSRQN